MDNIFLKKLYSGERLISDGATGTNLQERGLERGTPSEYWVLQKPEMIIQLHKDFIDAGADILLTSTFSANHFRISAELKDKVYEVNKYAVSLAREAIGDKEIFVAGSIGPLGKLLDPYGPLSRQEALDAYTEQAGALSQAGVDLIVIETQFDINEANLAVEAVRNVSDKPIVCSFSFDRGVYTMMGINPTKMAEELDITMIDVVGINCGRSLDDNLQALEELNNIVQIPIWFKPNAGMPVVDDAGEIKYSVTPQQMGKASQVWVENGAQIIGGCCGTTPEHLSQIAKSVIN